MRGGSVVPKPSPKGVQKAVLGPALGRAPGNPQAKGKEAKIPLPAMKIDIGSDPTKLRDAGRCREVRSLCILTVSGAQGTLSGEPDGASRPGEWDCPETQVEGWESVTPSVAFAAQRSALENRRARVIFSSGRTETASGAQG